LIKFCDAAVCAKHAAENMKINVNEKMKAETKILFDFLIFHQLEIFGRRRSENRKEKRVKFTRFLHVIAQRFGQSFFRA
jgi:phosphodiesterase/alkaline phosphatase D-like protein